MSQPQQVALVGTFICVYKLTNTTLVKSYVETVHDTLCTVTILCKDFGLHKTLKMILNKSLKPSSQHIRATLMNTCTNIVGSSLLFHCFTQPGRAMVVVQLVERSLPIPEVRGSNPVIDKLYFTCILSIVLKRQKLRKRGREWPIF